MTKTTETPAPAVVIDWTLDGVDVIDAYFAELDAADAADVIALGCSDEQRSRNSGKRES